jgi:hypothetical protein
MVLDVSRTGLFVQTSASPAPGESLGLHLDLAEAAVVPVTAQVVWQRRVAPQLRQVARGGLGLRIHSAAEPYYRLLARLARVSEPKGREAPPAAAAQAVVHPRFKVLLKRDGAPRTRTVETRASDTEAARAQALRLAGSGWSVLEVRES